MEYAHWITDCFFFKDVCVKSWYCVHMVNSSVWWRSRQLNLCCTFGIKTWEWRLAATVLEVICPYFCIYLRTFCWIVSDALMDRNDLISRISSLTSVKSECR